VSKLRQEFEEFRNAANPGLHVVMLHRLLESLIDAIEPEEHVEESTESEGESTQLAIPGTIGDSAAGGSSIEDQHAPTPDPQSPGNAAGPAAAGKSPAAAPAA